MCKIIYPVQSNKPTVYHMLPRMLLRPTKRRSGECQERFLVDTLISSPTLISHKTASSASPHPGTCRASSPCRNKTLGSARRHYLGTGPEDRPCSCAGRPGLGAGPKDSACSRVVRSDFGTRPKDSPCSRPGERSGICPQGNRDKKDEKIPCSP